MPSVPKDRPLQPTILDRLVDADRGESGFPRVPRGQTLGALMESVRRDLDNLLNTRRRPVEWPVDPEELGESLLNYGIPDFSGANASSAEDLQRFLDVVADVIRACEPRFKSVAIEFVAGQEKEDRTLRFRIRGLLYARPAPEPAVFDTEMEPATGGFAVKIGQS